MVVLVAVFVPDVGFEVWIVLLRIVLFCLLLVDQIPHIVAAVGLPFVDTMVEAVVHKCKAFVEPLVAVNIAVTQTLDILQLLACIVDKPVVVVFVGTAVDKVVAHIFGMAVEVLVVYKPIIFGRIHIDFVYSSGGLHVCNIVGHLH